MYITLEKINERNDPYQLFSDSIKNNDLQEKQKSKNKGRFLHKRLNQLMSHTMTDEDGMSIRQPESKKLCLNY